MIERLRRRSACDGSLWDADLSARLADHLDAPPGRHVTVTLSHAYGTEDLRRALQAMPAITEEQAQRAVARMRRDLYARAAKDAARIAAEVEARVGNAPSAKTAHAVWRTAAVPPPRPESPAPVRLALLGAACS